jgi:ribonuclease-3
LGSYFLGSRYGVEHLKPDLVEEILASRGLKTPALVRPLLGIIQISPSAFLGFVGDWKPVESESGEADAGHAAIEHLIYRWVFDCIGDLAVTRLVPDMGDVMRASVRPEHTLAQRHEPPLLELWFKDGTVIGFEAGFDTDHEFYQGDGDAPEDVHEIERNPENCWVEIWMDHVPPAWGDQGLEARMGYSFERPELLKQILAESAVPGSKNKRPPLLKQAATLGDAILETYVTTELLRRKRDMTSQQINDLRKQVVKNETLAALAVKLDLPVEVRFPYAPPGSLSWNEERIGMLGDSVEALIGAAYMDGGLKGAFTVTSKLMQEPLAEAAPRWPARPKDSETPTETDVEGD